MWAGQFGPPKKSGFFGPDVRNKVGVGANGKWKVSLQIPRLVRSMVGLSWLIILHSPTTDIQEDSPPQ